MAAFVLRPHTGTFPTPCSWMEHCLAAQERIILYLAILCQNESCEGSRWASWAAAIGVHLGSYLPIWADLGGGVVKTGRELTP